MKRIGLLTFHFPVNYGATLQTYALYTFLKSIGFDVEIIDFYTEEHRNRYCFYQKPKSIKALIYNALKTLFFNDYLKKNKNFHSFLNGHFNLSKRFKDERSISFDYDYVITGSDQVFNLENAKSMVYFQPFQKKDFQKKIAYAPSFGISDFTDDFKNKIGIFVKDFDAISCRENDGASFLSDITGHSVPQVLDPVFLLNMEEWSHLSSKRLIKEDYIFIYDLNGKKPLIDIAKTQNLKNYKIVMVSNEPLAKIRREYKGVDVFYNSASVEDFLSLIRYSVAVVTDSFHGTAFSIIFQRPFYTYIAFEKTAGRIKSLLCNLSMQNRILYKENLLNEITSLYEFPDRTRLNDQIENSMTYLIHSLYE